MVSGAILGLPAAAVAAEAGGQSSGDTVFPNVGNSGYDALHYDVSIKYEPTTNAMVSTTTLRATAATALSSFSLDFKGLSVDSVTVNGAPATFERIDDAAATKFKLVVTPAEPVVGEFVTVIEYSGVPAHYVDPDGSWEGWVKTDDGATAVNEPIGAMTWYPNNNTPSDKATHKFTIDIPSKNAAGDSSPRRATACSAPRTPTRRTASSAPSGCGTSPSSRPPTCRSSPSAPTTSTRTTSSCSTAAQSASGRSSTRSSRPRRSTRPSRAARGSRRSCSGWRAVSAPIRA
ncbi:gluzincin family metallopeptidase [Leucobacter soli]|uniref:hypothetical protein n=1 Tax=Leucobacter soli TaxID=2812850 RepID=UPI00360D6A1E